MIDKLSIPGVAKVGQRCLVGDHWVANLDKAEIFLTNPQGRLALDYRIKDRDMWTDPITGDIYQNQKGALVLVQKHTPGFTTLCPSKGEGMFGSGRFRRLS